MKQNWKPLACLVLALALPAISLAQSKLILPQSQEDIRQLTKKEDAGPCVRCGVVTNVRSESRERTQSRESTPPPAGGMGNDSATTPIFGSGSTVKDARNATKPTTYYKLTVRYDDGKYAVFEQDDKPEMQKGDKVEAINGRLERRSN